MKVAPIIFFKFNTKSPQAKSINFKSITQIPKEDEFVQNTGSLDIARLKQLGIKNFRLIDSNSIRGVTLANQKRILLRELKECGINTIIDLRKEGSDDSKYAMACKENGLDYFNFKIKINMPIFNEPFTSNLSQAERQVENNNFISMLPEFFKLMDQGKFYMACLLGLHRTDLAVVMNYLLNPNEPKTPPLLTHMYLKDETDFTNKYIGAMKNLLKNITEEQRRFLKLPDNFKDLFDVRVLKLRIMNGNPK